MVPTILIAHLDINDIIILIEKNELKNVKELKVKLDDILNNENDVAKK